MSDSFEKTARAWSDAIFGLTLVGKTKKQDSCLYIFHLNRIIDHSLCLTETEDKTHTFNFILETVDFNKNNQWKTNHMDVYF